MNVYEYAMKVEKDGEHYYRELATKTNDAGVKSILTMLADEEVKHYALFEKMNKNQIIPTQPSVDIFKHTKNMFEKMQKENKSPSFSQDQIEFYKSALLSEENSYKFYTEKALMLEEGEQKKAFLRIAEEERAHYVLLENLVEYISAPESWVESAEFNHLSTKFVQKTALL
ncbi:ferritin-like domain-containing protein [Sulfurospirillum arsenophilum]|uniref:ferritin-like domain-containing protein n=1 Tax=Sulfurospirillum arsenophilum TaxID=56698 RepID=UPI0005A7E49A|nr:ferritin family protein [Sulfurospirillum arsenophilum]